MCESRIPTNPSHYRGDVMDFDQQLKTLAAHYSSRGYDVTVMPTSDQLPDFAKDFKVEIMACRSDDSALVSVKKSVKEFETDSELTRYARLTEQKPGWRFDAVVLSPDAIPAAPSLADLKEPSEENIRKRVEVAKQWIAIDTNQALVAAWSVLEAATRRWLQSTRRDPGKIRTSITLMNELLSGGAISRSDFEQIQGLSQLRNSIVHGFDTAEIEPGSVEFLLSVADGLLNSAKAA